MNSDFRIRSGTFTSAGLTASYVISDFAIQSGQGLTPWALTQIEPPEAQVKRRAISSKVVPDGQQRFTWRFSLMTFGMYSYWRSQFLPSEAESGTVTVKTYDRYDVAIYFNATISELSRGQPNAKGYPDVVWEFFGTETA